MDHIVTTRYDASYSYYTSPCLHDTYMISPQTHGAVQHRHKAKAQGFLCWLSGYICFIQQVEGGGGCLWVACHRVVVAGRAPAQLAKLSSNNPGVFGSPHVMSCQRCQVSCHVVQLPIICQRKRNASLKKLRRRPRRGFRCCSVLHRACNCGDEGTTARKGNVPRRRAEEPSPEESSN
jgi:hypothetical protein